MLEKYIVLIFGIFTALYSFYKIACSIRYTLWPKAEALIIDSGYNAFKTAPVNGGAYTVWQAYIVYEYQINNRKYVNNKLSSGLGISISPQKAEKVANKYPKQTYAQVSYNPSKPEQSIVNTRPPISSLLMLIFAPIIIVIGLAHAAT